MWETREFETVLLDTNTYQHQSADRVAEILLEDCRASVLVGTVFWESAAQCEWWHEVFEHLPHQATKQGIKHLVVLLDRVYKDRGFRRHPFVHYLDYHALRLKYALDQGQHHNRHWPSQTRKFLFLTGQPWKPNRLRLLWKLDRAGVLDRGVWSLWVEPWAQQRTLESMLDQVDLAELQTWISRHQQRPDGADILPGSGRIRHGCRWGPGLYESTRCSIISETRFNLDPPYPMIISEKTYKTLLNNHAFVMASQPGTLDRLRAQGFRTFERYLPWPGYDQEMDPDLRLDQIVENVVALCDLDKNLDDLAQDIEHNYRQFWSLIDRNLDSLYSIMRDREIQADYTQILDFQER